MHKQHYMMLLFTVLIAALALYCYNPWLLYFQNDDFIHIPLSAQGTIFQHNSFRPLCDLSIMLDFKLFGTNAAGYHCTNLLLHIACSVLVYFLMQAVTTVYFNREQWFFACLSAVLFFVYAMHSEPVFWILGRSAMLGTLFALLFLLYFLKRQKSNKHLALAIIFLCMGLLSYESCWVLPLLALIIVLADINTGKTTKASGIKNLILVWMVFIIYLLLRYAVIHEIAGNYEAALLYKADVFTLCKNYIVLITRSFITPFDQYPILPIACIVCGAILVIVYMGLIATQRRKINLLLLCFLISQLPYCSLGIDTHGTEGERFLYLPIVIICITAGILFTISTIKISYKMTGMGLLLAVHLIALLCITPNYRFAGAINKQLVHALHETGNKTHTIIAAGVPQAQYGALILREGLPEMIHWLCKNKSNDTVIICSQRNENLPLGFPYSIRTTDQINWPCSKNKINDSTTMLLNFTDTALLISY
jgi:hypothetical protein